jgi:hypothetical protein
MKLWLGLGLLVALFSPQAVRAASAINLSPASHDVVLTSEQPIQNLSFTLTNQTSDKVTVTLSAVDFGPLDETGGVAFLGQDNTTWQHRLTPWLTIDQERLTMAAGQSVTATVRLENRLDLTPGGHYAAVLARLADDEQPVPTGVGWQGVLASQFYVLKKGGEQYDLRLHDITPTGLMLTWPKEISLRWWAGGNTHVKPYGTISVTSVRGRKVAEAVINTDSALLLPEATRVLASSLIKKGLIWPGKYTVQIGYHHQANSELIWQTVTWWYLPWWLVLIGLAIVGQIWRKRRG